MNTHDFTISFLVKNSPGEVFKTILDVRGWWTGLYSEEIEGNSDVLDGEFSFRAGAGVHYSKHKLIDIIPNKKVVWEVTDAELSFVQNKDEWTGTKVCFDISEMNGQTHLKFTHEGLVPEMECYTACSTTWTKYLQERLLKVLSIPAKHQADHK
jgi:hypothetical protein